MFLSALALRERELLKSKNAKANILILLNHSSPKNGRVGRSRERQGQEQGQECAWGWLTGSYGWPREAEELPLGGERTERRLVGEEETKKRT